MARCWLHPGWKLTQIWLGPARSCQEVAEKWLGFEAGALEASGGCRQKGTDRVRFSGSSGEQGRSPVGRADRLCRRIELPPIAIRSRFLLVPSLRVIARLGYGYEMAACRRSYSKGLSTKTANNTPIGFSGNDNCGQHGPIGDSRPGLRCRQIVSIWLFTALS